jgi:hypothetical protein
MENIYKSKSVKWIIISIGIVIFTLGVLRIGISVGYHKAKFAGQFGNNFERNFLGPKDGNRKMFFDGGIPGGHGAFGEILSINLPNLIITGPDNLEKTVLIGTSTLIRRFQENIKNTDLKIGDSVVVIGNPNDEGQVEASLIRIMPAPSEEFSKRMMK